MISQQEHIQHVGFLTGPNGGEKNPLFEVVENDAGIIALRSLDPFDDTPTGRIAAEAIPKKEEVQVDVYNPSVDIYAVNALVKLVHPPEGVVINIRPAAEGLTAHTEALAAIGHFATSQAV